MLAAGGLQRPGVSQRCSRREAALLPEPRGKGEKSASLFCFFFLAMDNVKETARKAQQERACKHFCLALQVMEFYCESCETAMCLDCTEGEHREHVTVPLRDVVEQHKAVLKTQLDAIRSRWGHFDEALRIFASHQVV